MRNLYILLFLITVVLSSCSKHKTSNSAEIYYNAQGAAIFDNKMTLRDTASVSFPIDSSTSFTISSLYVFNQDSIRYFTFYNILNRSIYVYNYDTRLLVKKIVLQKKGKDAVGTNPKYLSYYMNSLDTIIVSDMLNYHVFLLNGKGSVLKTLNIPFPGKGKFIVGMESETERPMHLKDDKLYITGDLLDYSIEDQTKVKNVIVYDLRDRSISRCLPRPDLLNKGVWSGYQFRLYNTFNTQTQKFIYSFTADPFIYETDNLGDTKKHYVGSKFFNKILPYKWEKDFSMSSIPFDELMEHDYTTPQFYKIIYDPYHDVYYRSALLPLTKAEYNDPLKRGYRKESLIIIDRNFNKVGEVLLPYKQYSTNMFFLTKEGLHIAEIPDLQKSEDKLTFKVFQLIKTKP